MLQAAKRISSSLYQGSTVSRIQDAWGPVYNDIRSIARVRINRYTGVKAIKMSPPKTEWQARQLAYQIRPGDARQAAAEKEFLVMRSKFPKDECLGDAEDSTSSSGENDSSMALSDLSSPPGDDVQPSDGPAPEAAASATKRDRVEPDRIARPKMKSEPASTVDGASPELVEVMVEADDTPTLRSKQTRPTMPPKPKKRPDTDIYKQASGDQQVLVASITEVRADGSDLVSDSGRTTPQTSSEAATSSAPAEKTRHFTTRQGKAIATSRKVIPVKGRPPLPPRIPKSIWFDFDDDPKGPTSPVLPAAAPAKRKRASRRQMFQTVLRISAVNRAADDATRAEAPENPSSSHRLHKSALRDRCRAALLLHVTTDAPIQVPRSVAALPVPLPRKVSALSAASQVWTRGLASPPFSEAPPALTETDMAQSTASAPGRTASELTWFAPTSIQAFSWSLRSYSAGLYPAATVRLSESLFFLTSRSRTAVSPIACLSGHGKYQLTTPVGTLACWPVAALARLSLRQDTAPYLHQTLGDPGLEAPPRLETSIPAATSLCAAQRCPRPSQFPTGMPATLATGEGYYRFFLLSHSTELLLLQGWPDSYQDDQDCAVCDRHRSKTPPVETLPLDRRPRTSSTISWIRCCPGESSDDNVPKDLEHMVAAMRCTLDNEPPVNDLSWIMGLASQPGEASLLAKTAAELADNALYLMALRLLWPLLSSDQQLEVQQWFQRYARGSSAPGVRSHDVRLAATDVFAGFDVRSLPDDSYNDFEAKYRGRWWTAQELGCEAGSLPSGRNLELQAWLRSPEGLEVQIAVVQETHWRGPLEHGNKLHPPCPDSCQSKHRGTFFQRRDIPRVPCSDCGNAGRRFKRTNESSGDCAVLTRGSSLIRCLQAAAAAAPGLQRVHQALRVFAPKAPRRKLQLRAPNGMPLCIADTVKAISTYYTDLFGRTVLSCQLPEPSSPLQLTYAEFQSAIQGLSGNKALPPAVTPAALWILAADTLAMKLLPQVNHWLRHMHLAPPDDWHIADICLLPKTNKPVAGPETLRPISLLHPVAKALAVVINGRIRPQLQALVQELPQFSYLEGRSVQDALDRAMAHCSHVRSILHAQRQNPHLKRQGHEPAACRGGVTLSLDLQKAFDLMPRDNLLAAMQLANLDYSVQYAVLQLHSHAYMRFAHGPLAGSTLRPHVKKVPGKGKHLRIPLQTEAVFHAQTCMLLPMVAQHTYLGAKLSYSSPEALTLKERMKLSWTAFGRLLPALRSAGLTLGQRVQLWQTCVFTSLLHSLDSVGLVPGLMTEAESPVISPDTAAAMRQGLLTPEGQAKLLQGMMQGSWESNPLGLNLNPDGTHPSTAAPSTASSANPPFETEEGDDMDTTQHNKRAAPENPGLPWNTQAEQSQTGKGGKFPRQESKRNTRDYGGGWSRDHRRSPGQRRQQWTLGENDTRAAKDVTDKKILNLCTALTNLVLRHEDQMSINRSQSNYVMFCQSKGMLTVVPEFIKAIQAWKEAKEKQPETITLPMRAFLLKLWLELLTKRFEACLANDTSKAQAAEMLVLDSNGMVPYLQWDQQAKEMKVKKDREPMRPEQVLEMLTRMQALALQPLAVMRFHAIHKLGWQMSSEVVPMMLEIGGRTQEANRLWEDFGRLSHSGATRCVATSLRPDKMGRSAPDTAAEAIRRHVRTLRLRNPSNHCYANDHFAASGRSKKKKKHPGSNRVPTAGLLFMRAANATDKIERPAYEAAHLLPGCGDFARLHNDIFNDPATARETPMTPSWFATYTALIQIWSGIVGRLPLRWNLNPAELICIVRKHEEEDAPQPGDAGDTNLRSLLSGRAHTEQASSSHDLPMTRVRPMEVGSPITDCADEEEEEEEAEDVIFMDHSPDGGARRCHGWSWWRGLQLFSEQTILSSGDAYGKAVCGKLLTLHPVTPRKIQCAEVDAARGRNNSPAKWLIRQRRLGVLRIYKAKFRPRELREPGSQRRIRWSRHPLEPVPTSHGRPKATPQQVSTAWPYGVRQDRVDGKQVVYNPTAAGRGFQPAKLKIVGGRTQEPE
ncbi:unnamed protein product [Symbiodinium sp. KB8]|nr:unnamed protein product [Symbiodinium sp. KB8]